MRHPYVAYPTAPFPVPDWFTNLHHRISRRRCRRAGSHQVTFWPSCNRCGARWEGSNEEGGWGVPYPLTRKEIVERLAHPPAP